MFFEIRPGFVGDGFGIPIFTFQEVNAGLKHLVVGYVEDGCVRVWVTTRIGIIHRSFDLVNQLFKRLIGVSVCLEFCHVPF